MGVDVAERGACAWGETFSERGKGGEGGGALWGCVFEAGECSEERSDLKDHPNVPGGPKYSL